MIDVVDEQDNILKTVPRKEVIDNILRHRGIQIFVFNSKGEILIHKRTMTKDSFPGFYDMSICGHVDSGENYDETAQREIAEEIGARDVKIESLFKYSYEGDDNKVIAQAYKCIYDGEINFQKEEVETGFFVNIDKLKEMIEAEKFCPDSLVGYEKYEELQ